MEPSVLMCFNMDLEKNDAVPYHKSNLFSSLFLSFSHFSNRFPSSVSYYQITYINLHFLFFILVSCEAKCSLWLKLRLKFYRNSTPIKTFNTPRNQESIGIFLKLTKIFPIPCLFAAKPQKDIARARDQSSFRCVLPTTAPYRIQFSQLNRARGPNQRCDLHNPSAQIFKTTTALRGHVKTYFEIVAHVTTCITGHSCPAAFSGNVGRCFDGIGFKTECVFLERITFG